MATRTPQSVRYHSETGRGADARFDGRNGLKRLVGRGGGGGGERREEGRAGDQKTEGGPEIIDTFS